MQAVTLSRTHRFVTQHESCRHCHKFFKAGDQVLTHAFGKDAPWDLRHFSIHGSCVKTVQARLKTLPPDSVLGEALLAEQFRQLTERIRAGEPVLQLGGRG